MTMLVSKERPQEKILLLDLLGAQEEFESIPLPDSLCCSAPKRRGENSENVLYVIAALYFSDSEHFASSYQTKIPNAIQQT